MVLKIKVMENKKVIVCGGGHLGIEEARIVSTILNCEITPTNQVSEGLQQIIENDRRNQIDFSQPIQFINPYSKIKTEMLNHYFPADYYIYKSKGKTKIINHNRKKSKAAKKQRKNNRKK